MQASETPEVAKDERNIAEIKCKISNHILYFDVLTILASFAVVAMHVNSAYWSYRDAPSWVLNLIIEKTCVWAVSIYMYDLFHYNDISLHQGDLQFLG